MRMSRYILVGMLLGFVLYKSEAVSWFRIYEMFRFQSFHMYGIIGSFSTNFSIFFLFTYSPSNNPDLK